MKNFFKTMGAFACFLMAAVFFLPAQAQAGGIWAEVNVKYVVLKENGGYRTCATQTEEEYLGLTAVLTWPNGEQETSTITEMTGKSYELVENENGEEEQVEGYFAEHRFFLANELDVSNMIPGVYALSSYDVPKGYEYDNAMEDTYPLYVTITQQDIDDYVEWAKNFKGADGKVFQIIVPVKKTGTVSAVLQKPKKAQLSFKKGNTFIGPDSYNSAYTAEYQYATKKNGKYTTLGEGNQYDNDYYFRDSSCPLKHGKTYYIRARYYKVVNGEKIYGDFGKAVKVKVVKSEVAACKLTLKTSKVTSAGKVETHLNINISGETAGYKIKLSYATKKNGKYKELKDSFRVDTNLSEIKKLKKGKTYYIKVRLLDDLTGENIYGSYTKAVKVKMKK
jgi:hypothetical protein